uniref:Putative secreted protein n=1 Tax=Anopheles marajoara TaxID=58244 RepID=A0A2M4C9U2_9DIPT
MQGNQSGIGGVCVLWLPTLQTQPPTLFSSSSLNETLTHTERPPIDDVGVPHHPLKAPSPREAAYLSPVALTHAHIFDANWPFSQGITFQLGD